MLSSLFTFGNIRTATDGQPVSPVSEVETARPSASLPHPPCAMHYSRASEASGCQVVQFTKWHTVKTITISILRASVASGKPNPYGGLTIRRKFRIDFRNLCHFFREVKQNKGITLRTTKVSHYRVFTLFWFIMVSTPYQFSFTVVAIHFFIQGEVMDILPSSCSMT